MEIDQQRAAISLPRRVECLGNGGMIGTVVIGDPPQHLVIAQATPPDRDAGRGKRVVWMLTVRVALSVSLVAFLVLSYYMGWIGPGGIR